MKNIIEAAENFAQEEISKFNKPPKFLYDLANDNGIRLAKIIKADIDIVKIGTRLMDIKLGQAAVEGKVGEHTRMSVEAANEFLEKFKTDKDIKEKIINCVEAHHGGPYKCIEAEICANADCYKFIHPRGFFSYLISLGKTMPLEDALKQAESKLEEKHKILSLEIAKNELEPYYQAIKKLLRGLNE